MGNSNSETLRVTGHIHLNTLTILIDGDSTHNFIQESG